MIANKVNVMGQEYQILKVSRDQYKTCEGLDGAMLMARRFTM